MRLSRIFVDATLTPGSRVQLPATAAGHLVRVLRLHSGDPLVLFDGRGGEFAALIDAVHGTSVSVLIGDAAPVERESHLTLRLAQGVSRAERMDLVVQKATELGVSEILPVLTERSVVRLDAKQAQRRAEHWLAIAIAACEQSGRNRVPAIAAPQSLGEFLRTDVADSTRLLLSPIAGMRLSEIPRPNSSVTVLIGPEGGLAPAEQESALARGYSGVRMGPRVLRTETAAIVALTLLQREFGDI